MFAIAPVCKIDVFMFNSIFDCLTQIALKNAVVGL